MPESKKMTAQDKLEHDTAMIHAVDQYQRIRGSQETAQFLGRGLVSLLGETIPPGEIFVMKFSGNDSTAQVTVTIRPNEKNPSIITELH